jgi:plastocyanin
MSMPRSRAAIAALVVAGLASAGALRWFSLGAADRGGEPQEIVLVARDMAFHRAGEPATANPTLSLPAGGRVRLTLRNREPGVTHNFSIPAWDVDSGTVSGPGEAHVEFVVPRTKGREGYQCTPHATMMRGVIQVE